MSHVDKDSRCSHKVMAIRRVTACVCERWLVSEAGRRLNSPCLLLPLSLSRLCCECVMRGMCDLRDFFVLHQIMLFHSICLCVDRSLSERLMRRAMERRWWRRCDERGKELVYLRSQRLSLLRYLADAVHRS